MRHGCGDRIGKRRDAAQKNMLAELPIPSSDLKPSLDPGCDYPALRKFDRQRRHDVRPVRNRRRCNPGGGGALVVREVVNEIR